MGNERFIELCVEHRVSPDAISDFVERWHTADSAEPLNEYLGMTFEEYALWVERPDALEFIIAAHERGLPIEEVVVQSLAVPELAMTAASLAAWIERKSQVRAAQIAG